MKGILSILLLLLMYLPGYGQSMGGPASGTIMVYSIQNISITNLKTMVSFSTANDYLYGIVTDEYAQIDIRSNENWQVNISAQSARFTPLTQGASKDMPANILGVRLSGYSSFKQLGTQSVTLKSGSRGGASSSKNSFKIDMKFDPGFSYNGGLYSIGVLYTLTKQ